MSESGDKMTDSETSALPESKLVEVTVQVHPANLKRLISVAREWEVDAASISPALWQAALECTRGDDLIARQFLEARLMYMGDKRLVDVAASGPGGLAKALEYLGQVAAGVYV